MLFCKYCNESFEGHAQRASHEAKCLSRGKHCQYCNEAFSLNSSKDARDRHEATCSYNPCEDKRCDVCNEVLVKGALCKCQRETIWPQEKTSVKQDGGKLRYDLMPFDALDKVAEVLTYGINKYPNPEQNWRVNSTPADIKRFEAAMLRHISEWMQGNPIDEESKLSHMAHVVTNALFILALKDKEWKI
jgi:hypothetical protein